VSKRRPILHVLAGPNGAGKSTLYQTKIAPRFRSAEFVNPDLIAEQHFGRHPKSFAEVETAQRLAEARRRELMATRCDLVTESTFSHPSKLALLQDARAMGYDVRVYHVNLRSAALAVKRVARRARRGGHNVPESKTKERYERNQPLIREAVRIAHRAYVFDNSEFGKPSQVVLEFAQGSVVFVGHHVPRWAMDLYASELRGYAPGRLNRPAASFAAARKMSVELMGADTRVFIAKLSREGVTQYEGEILAETDLHILQRTAATEAIAHFKSRLHRVPRVGERCRIVYKTEPLATVIALSKERTTRKRPHRKDTQAER
jgi:predicted ABC-type ATPase